MFNDGGTDWRADCFPCDWIDISMVAGTEGGEVEQRRPQVL